MKIKKRDGRLKDFDKTRIFSAIKSAYLDVYNHVYNDELEKITENVYNSVIELNKTVITIEEIQDIVINELSKVNNLVAESYSDYRNDRTKFRESNMKLISNIMGLFDSTNIDVLTENSNKQSKLISTQRDLMAGEISKYISSNLLIPKHLMDAHYKGIIKIHDLDYFLNPLTNCELINIEDMLQNGTVINKKKIDKPKSLRTAMTLVTQISAQVASCTYGGQTITLSHIAPFVRISKEKITKKYKSMNLPISDERLQELINKELQDEIKDSVQTFNYQVSTLMTTNGQVGCLY